MTTKIFWCNFLMVMGGFLAVFAGGCGIIFEIIALTPKTSPGENYLGSPILPLIFGGIPALAGFGVFMLGKWLRRRVEKKVT